MIFRKTDGRHRRVPDMWGKDLDLQPWSGDTLHEAAVLIQIKWIADATQTPDAHTTTVQVDFLIYVAEQNLFSPAHTDNRQRRRKKKKRKKRRNLSAGWGGDKHLPFFVARWCSSPVWIGIKLSFYVNLGASV